MADNAKRGNEVAMIDCALVVMTTKGSNAKSLALDTASQIEVAIASLKAALPGIYPADETMENDSEALSDKEVGKEGTAEYDDK